MKRSLVGISIGFLLCVVIILWPTQYRHVESVGTDAYNTHYQVFGSHTKTINLIAPHTLSGIGLIVVNMRHAEQLPPLHVVVTSKQLPQPLVQDVSLSHLEDDAFTWILFSQTIAKQGDVFSVEISGPHATAASAVGIRFDGDTKQVALGTIQSVPYWKYVRLWSHDNPVTAMNIFSAIIAGIIFIVVGFAGRMLGEGKWVKRALFVLLIVFTLTLRVPLAASIESGFGGDMFNYLLKSRALIDGNDPFAADPRKAPLYPLLAAPGLAQPFDAVVWERWVSMLAAVGIVILVPLFLMELGVPFAIALVGGALIAVNRDLQFESVQGLSNTLYAFLILLASYMLLAGRSYAVAVWASLATLARYEGGAALAILLPGSWIAQWLPIKKILRTLIPVVILFPIPFSIAPFSHHLGVRTVADIQSDDGLYVAYSMQDFFSNLQGFKHLFGRLWILTPTIGNPFAMFGIGVLIGVGIAVVRRILSSRVSTIFVVIPYILAVLLGVLILQGSSEILVGVFSLMAGAGIALMLIIRPKHIIPITLMLVAQIIVVTMILPKDRYYLPVIPFVAITIVYAISYASRSRMGLVGSLLCIGMITGFAYADATHALPGQVSDYNEKSAGQTVLLHAAQFLKSQSDIIAVADQSDLQIRTYFSVDRYVSMPDSVRDIDQQFALLQSRHVAYIIETTENPYFAKLLATHPERFQQVQIFTTKWATTTATIYRLTQ